MTGVIEERALALIARVTADPETPPHVLSEANQARLYDWAWAEAQRALMWGLVAGMNPEKVSKPLGLRGKSPAESYQESVQCALRLRRLLWDQPDAT